MSPSGSTGEQPDFNWDHPEVREEFESVLRFWFDRGADGFRVDSAALLIKDLALPVDDPEEHAYTDREEVHQVYRSWRRVADSYSGGRVLIGEVWLPDAERLARYLRPGELHTIFNFSYLECAWDAKALRTVIDDTLRLHRAVHAPATWVLSNHDVDRVVTRYGREGTSFAIYARRHGRPGDLPPGRPAARHPLARAAALLTQALPGSVYLYQGEELGLWEVEEIPDELRQDPMWERKGRNPADPGRADRSARPASSPRTPPSGCRSDATRNSSGRSRAEPDEEGGCGDLAEAGAAAMVVPGGDRSGVRGWLGYRP
ncbi:alpha-amylase family glycosyl hydrolase [Kitasatospora sp. NPDC101447]|uniref:alpha-amylase family glycosyl hydrolase n=1 Tax=Kitasatospora sp. NPDC101447 TaxID=3364102 RepID=UPI0038170986